MSVASMSAQPMVLDGYQDASYNHSAKDVLFSKLHRGRKWFDSGEYFMNKQGVAMDDLLPGGAPVEGMSPKLVPTVASERGSTNLQHTTTAQSPAPRAQACRSDY